MNWQIIIAMLVAIPVIMLPIAFLWYTVIGNLFNSFKNRQAARVKSKRTYR